MTVSVIPIVAGALGTVFKNVIKDWKNWRSEEESKPFRPQHC